MNANIMLIVVKRILSVDIDVFFSCTVSRRASALSSVSPSSWTASETVPDGSSGVGFPLRLSPWAGRSVLTPGGVGSLVSNLSFSLVFRRMSVQPFSGNPAYEYLESIFSKRKLGLDLYAYSISTESSESTRVIPDVKRNYKE